MNNRARVALIAMVLSPARAHAFGYLEARPGVPDYEKHPAFTSADPKIHADLRSALRGARASSKPCKAGSATVAPDWTLDLQSNVCDDKSFGALQGLVSRLAPSLRRDRITAWVAELDGDKEPDLIVGHVDISQEKDVPRHPFLSLWRLKFHDGAYRAVHAGPFLVSEVDLQAVRAFGNISDRKAVFVRHVSCIECEPDVYLTAIDFDATADAKAYEFTYSKDHRDHGLTIEFALPGMGHSVDARVETRLLPPSRQGPHLLQSFRMEEDEGPDEWWAFTCKGYRCDYRMHTGQPPGEFMALWKKAKKL
ncbi:MAG: hypothetical protein HY927_04705 [Elusimicrobia bacterium]|nr:hypothetical protein [Elusimicrobiota bacterium]